MNQQNPAIRTLSVIVPAYNEERTISTILDSVLAVELPGGIAKEIVVVNDSSTDATDQRVRDYLGARPKAPVRYIVHERNQGKGAAIHTGIRLASGDAVIVQDADLEYDPREYGDLLRPMIEGRADVVYGSRFKGSHPHRILFFWHSIGNHFLTFLSNMFTNLNLTDMETCYKLFRSELIKSLPLKEKRFGFEPEVTARISRLPGVRIYEIGISYYGRTYAEGKKIDWKDGIRAVYCIVKYNLFSRS